MQAEASGGLNVVSIWRLYLQGMAGGPKLRMFQEWYTFGSKYARLAAGGALSLSKYKI